MPNLKLTGRTSDFVWSGCQEVSRPLTTCNLLQHCPARSERSKFVRWNVSSSPLFFSVTPFAQFYSSHSLLFPHLFNTFTSFMTFVNLLLSVSCYCCLSRVQLAEQTRLHVILGPNGPLSLSQNTLVLINSVRITHSIEWVKRCLKR